MSGKVSRRSVLKGAGTVAGLAAIGTGTVGASEDDDLFIVNTGRATLSTFSNVSELVFDWTDEIEHVAVKGDSDRLDADDSAFRDRVIEHTDPDFGGTTGVDASAAGDALYDLQWDKKYQNSGSVHSSGFTGSGARVGIIDSGVAGAGGKVSHPDITPNVNTTLSMNFTGDGLGAGFVGDNHGTEVACCTAAVDDTGGLRGYAPDAELVDLRVFSSSGGASFSAIANAMIYGATPVSGGGAGCDVLNLSLGVPPLVAGRPGLPDPPAPLIRVSPLLVGLFDFFFSVLADYARSYDCLPVASAGNSGVNLAERVAPYNSLPRTFPASASGYLTVGATGPIGYGWPTDSGSRTISGGGKTFTLEDPINVEAPPTDPALYTNYGNGSDVAGAVDVTAGGGDIEVDAPVSSTTAGPVLDLMPAAAMDTSTSPPTPTYSYTAGTSFSAPNVSGLAALLYGIDPGASVDEVESTIKATASVAQVARSGSTAAPDVRPNVNGKDIDGDGFPDGDGEFDGDESSTGATLVADSVEYHGHGFIDIAAAVNSF